MKNYIETMQDFNHKLIDAMMIPSLMLDNCIRDQSNFKYGMTDQGDIVPLPSTSKIIWGFLSYPSDSLSKDLYHIIKSAGGSETK